MTARVPGAIVIVSFNTREHLRACLASTIAQGASRIVVADNGSTDGSVEMVEREFPEVELSIDRRNPGYGAGANRGIRACGRADVLLLNSDTRLAPGALPALQQYLDARPGVGIVGPRLANPDGSLQPSSFHFPTPLRPPLKKDPLALLLGPIPWARELCLATWSHARARRVPYVMGAALLIRRAAFDAVGGFDESFFMYAEEIDLCWRLRAAGWQTHFAPVTTVEHTGCASTSQHRADMLEQSAVSAMHFYRRRYSGVRLGAALFVIRASMAARLGRDWIRCRLAQDADRRRELAGNVGVWRRLLTGRHTAPAR